MSARITWSRVAPTWNRMFSAEASDTPKYPGKSTARRSSTMATTTSRDGSGPLRAPRVASQMPGAHSESTTAAMFSAGATAPRSG